MITVFIDGQTGTTGLKIYDRLKIRKDIELIEIPKEKQKYIKTKTEFLNNADLAILCLPDQAAVESVKLINNPKTKIIDASTAHRVDNNWTYGLPELNCNQKELIKSSSRVTNPGCYPTGFISAINPLLEHNIIPIDYPVTVHAVSGYSGGGKKMINIYEDNNLEDLESYSYRPYALSLNQKHIPEMQIITGLNNPPIFTPSVGNFYKGMLVSIPLFTSLLNKKLSARDVWEILNNFYCSEPFIHVMPFENDQFLNNGFLSPTGCNGTNRIELFVFGNDNQILLVARLDNLGKGSSGAVVQNMNIMLGFEEKNSLII